MAINGLFLQSFHLPNSLHVIFQRIIQLAFSQSSQFSARTSLHKTIYPDASSMCIAHNKLRVTGSHATVSESSSASTQFNPVGLSSFFLSCSGTSIPIDENLDYCLILSLIDSSQMRCKSSSLVSNLCHSVLCVVVLFIWFYAVIYLNQYIFDRSMCSFCIPM